MIMIDYTSGKRVLSSFVLGLEGQVGSLMRNRWYQITKKIPPEIILIRPTIRNDHKSFGYFSRLFVSRNDTS